MDFNFKNHDIQHYIKKGYMLQDRNEKDYRASDYCLVRSVYNRIPPVVDSQGYDTGADPSRDYGSSYPQKVGFGTVFTQPYTHDRLKFLEDIMESDSYYAKGLRIDYYTGTLTFYVFGYFNDGSRGREVPLYQYEWSNIDSDWYGAETFEASGCVGCQMQKKENEIVSCSNCNWEGLESDLHYANQRYSCPECYRKDWEYNAFENVMNSAETFEASGCVGCQMQKPVSKDERAAIQKQVNKFNEQLALDPDDDFERYILLDLDDETLIEDAFFKRQGAWRPLTEAFRKRWGKRSELMDKISLAQVGEKSNYAIYSFEKPFWFEYECDPQDTATAEDPEGYGLGFEFDMTKEEAIEKARQIHKETKGAITMYNNARKRSGGGSTRIHPKFWATPEMMEEQKKYYEREDMKWPTGDALTDWSWEDKDEVFNVEFNEWADQELMSHGKDISFKDWSKDEGMKHGNTEITEWAQHEDESHDARYGAETFEDENEFVVVSVLIKQHRPISREYSHDILITKEDAKKSDGKLIKEYIDGEAEYSTSSDWDVPEYWIDNHNALAQVKSKRQMMAETFESNSPKRKKRSSLLSEPFEGTSLDSGEWKGILTGFGIGLLGLFGYSKLRK